jgi:hypothetical protein
MAARQMSRDTTTGWGGVPRSSQSLPGHSDAGRGRTRTPGTFVSAQSVIRDPRCR